MLSNVVEPASWLPSLDYISNTKVKQPATAVPELPTITKPSRNCAQQEQRPSSHAAIHHRESNVVTMKRSHFDDSASGSATERVLKKHPSPVPRSRQTRRPLGPLKVARRAKWAPVFGKWESSTCQQDFGCARSCPVGTNSMPGSWTKGRARLSAPLDIESHAAAMRIGPTVDDF